MNDLTVKFLYAFGRLICPKRRFVMEKLPDEPAVFVGNHAGPIGPININYNFPLPFRPWVIDLLFDKKVRANYVFHDFFFGRSSKAKWFIRFLSKIVAAGTSGLLERVGIIKVSKQVLGMRKTFDDTVRALNDGYNIIVFPESFDTYKEYINKLHNGFVNIAGRYYKETGKCLKFYPMYIGPKQKSIVVGEPTVYDPTADPHAERERIALYLADKIDELAHTLPPHKARPFMLDVFYQYYPEFVNDPQSYWEFLAQPYSE